MITLDIAENILVRWNPFLPRITDSKGNDLIVNINEKSILIKLTLKG